MRVVHLTPELTVIVSQDSENGEYSIIIVFVEMAGNKEISAKPIFEWEIMETLDPNISKFEKIKNIRAKTEIEFFAANEFVENIGNIFRTRQVLEYIGIA